MIGKEQCAIVLRYVNDSYEVHEEFVGLYEADKVDAKSLVMIIKTTLLSLDIDIQNLRGQTYDGPSVMQGRLSGVATRIKDEVDKAISVHCLNHNLNLTLQEVAKVNTIVSSCLSIVQQLCNIIRNSPKRLAVFNSLQSGSSDKKSIKPLCPTRWCCRTDSLQSVLANYIPVLDTLDWIMQNGNKKSEGFKQAPGVLGQMEKFGTFFGLKLCLKLFSPVEMFAKQLQAKNILSCQTVLNVKSSLIEYLRAMRSDEHFQCLYDECIEEGNENGVGCPEDSLPRNRRPPKRLNDYYRVDGCASSVSSEINSTKQYYRHAFFESIDLMMQSIEDRFDQDTLKYLQNLEDVIISSVSDDSDCPSVDQLKKQFPLLVGDVDFIQLQRELSLLPASFKATFPHVKKVTSIDTIIDFMNHVNMKQTYAQFHLILRLYLTIPMSNATSERAFSTLRRVKNYLRTSLTQKHLNHHVMLHAHKNRLDSLDLGKIRRHFVETNEGRLNSFGKV